MLILDSIKIKAVLTAMIISVIFIQGCTLFHAEGEFDKALKSFRAEQYNEAYRHISAAEREFPSSRKYRSLLGWIYLKQGKLQKADQVFDGIYKEDNNDIGALQGFAWLDYRRNRLGASEKWFQKQLQWANHHVNSQYWINYDPADQKYILSILSDGYYGLGLIALSQHRYSHSKKMLLKALEYRNDFIGHDPIWTALGDVYYLQKKYETASTYYRKVWAEGKDAATAIKLGWSLKLAGDDTEARITFLQGLKTAKDRRPLLYGLALTDFSLKNIAESRRYLQELIQLDPYYADTEDILGIVRQTPSMKSLSKDFAAAYFKKGDYQRAYKHLTDYLHFMPNDCDARLMKAWSDIYLNRLQQALESFNTMLTISDLLGKSDCPKDQVLTGKGVALLYLNRLDDADSAFIKAYRLNPKNVRAKVAQGAVAYLKGHYTDAISIYTANMERLPKSEETFSWGSHALDNLGWSYFKTGHYKKAIEIFAKLKRYHPKPIYPTVFNGMGWSFFYLKQYRRAKNAFQHTLTLDPRNASAHAGLLGIARLKE
jgi:tetratricopeptide (TPR) repeat protein